MSVADVAADLGCSKEHIYDLIRDGQLSAIRVGKLRLSVSRASVDQFIAKREAA